MGGDIVEILNDLAGEVLAHHPRGDPDGVGDALVGGAAVAFHDEAVQSEEDGAIMVVRIEMVLEKLGGRARDEEADLRADGALEGAAKKVGDESGGALQRLEGDVAGEAVGDDDVD